MSTLRHAVADLGAGRFEYTASRRLGTWLLCCVGVTVLLTAISLLIGTTSIEDSLKWLLSPDAQSSVVL